MNKQKSPIYLTSKEIRKESEYLKALHKEGQSWIVKEGHAREYIRENISKDANILDVGVGNGTFLLELSNLGFNNLFGVDIDDYRLPKAKDLINLKPVDLNRENFPFEDNTFDVITALQVMEHLENPFHLAREAHRLLKPDGIFILAIPHEFNIWSRIRFLCKGNLIAYTDNNAHISFLTKDVFEKIYLRYFKIEKAIYKNGFFPYLGKLKLPRYGWISNRVCYFMRKYN
jgi:2-polyprenyl-3-methyl-5-hydroxy-6-metoxy-1,4-benzoquinol methylase